MSSKYGNQQITEIPGVWPSMIIDGEGDTWWLYSLRGYYASEWFTLPVHFTKIVEDFGITQMVE